MRLKVRRLLKGGEYLVSFETLGFNVRESARMEQFGTPSVDLRAMGLDIYRLDQIRLMTRYGSAEEATEAIGFFKRAVKDRLTELLARGDDRARKKLPGTPRKTKAWVLSLACAVALLMVTAYKGVISSQQITNQEEQMIGPVQMQASDDNINKEEDAVSYDKAGKSRIGALALRGDIGGGESVAYSYASSSPGDRGSGHPTLTRPDFTFAVLPEMLARYSEWGAEPAPPENEPKAQHFKIILTPLGGFEGPVTLGVTGSATPVKHRLYPQRVDKLPGSSTLMISVSPEELPQLCSDMIIIARGRSADGTLITHQKELTVAIRQRSSYQGPVWHVSTHGSDLSGDASYGSPFRTIQRAIDRASAGDTVLVQEGLYRENLSILDRDRIVLTSHFILDGDESTIKSTLIEAHRPGWVVTVGRSKEVSLTGFTIQKGKGKNGSLGGGIYCYSSSVDIWNNVITKNENQSGYGAGIYCYDSKASILHNQISSNCNYEGQGAGIYSYKSESDIAHNVINDNHASGGGSGIHLLEPNSAKVVRNSIYGDSGPSSVVLYKTGTGSQFLIANNTVSHNLGDAIRFFGGPWSFENNIIAENQGYGLFTLAGTALLSHNNVWSNLSGSDTTDYYGLGGDLTGSNGNISADPHFGNPVHGNFHLCFNSPCINSGNPNDPVPPDGGERIDMGVFEYTYPGAICGDVNRDGFTDYGDIDYLVDFLAARVAAPSPLEIGDVNCDDQIDKLDLGYLYQSLYYYGPKPCSDCESKDRLTGN